MKRRKYLAKAKSKAVLDTMFLKRAISQISDHPFGLSFGVQLFMRNQANCR